MQCGEVSAFPCGDQVLASGSPARVHALRVPNRRGDVRGSGELGDRAKRRVKLHEPQLRPKLLVRVQIDIAKL